MGLMFILVIFGYGVLLFVIVWMVEWCGLLVWVGWVVYLLLLVVYCSSWMFFGGVGIVVMCGWDYLVIYLGFVLVFLLVFKFFVKLVWLVCEEGLSLIVDFIFVCYGCSCGIVVIVVGMVLFVLVLYIVL